MYRTFRARGAGRTRSASGEAERHRFNGILHGPASGVSPALERAIEVAYRGCWLRITDEGTATWSLQCRESVGKVRKFLQPKERV